MSDVTLPDSRMIPMMPHIMKNPKSDPPLEKPFGHLHVNGLDVATLIIGMPTLSTIVDEGRFFNRNLVVLFGGEVCDLKKHNALAIPALAILPRPIKASVMFKKIPRRSGPKGVGLDGVLGVGLPWAKGAVPIKNNRKI